MIIGKESLKLLGKIYEPSTMVEIKFKRYDLAFKTDETGRPVLLFIGTKNEFGTIKGERFIRHLSFGANGQIIKDHWDNKGKTDR